MIWVEEEDMVPPEVHVEEIEKDEQILILFFYLSKDSLLDYLHQLDIKNERRVWGNVSCATRAIA